MDKKRLPTKVFAKAALGIVTSAMDKHQQRFRLDVQYSSSVLNFNNIFSSEPLYRAGRAMNSLPSQILERSASPYQHHSRKKNMKILFASLLILLTQLTFAQKESIDFLFKTFEKDIEVEQSYYGGKVIWDDDTRESYYSLMKVAPIDSLIKFIDNSNAAIRCIIFSGLVNKNADKKILSKILDNYHNDTAVYKNAPTDVHITWRVNEYMQTAFNCHDTTKNEMDYDKMIAKVREYPRIVLPGLRHGNIRKEEIIRIDSLGFNYNDLKILSFTAIFVRKSGSEVLKNESNFFATAMKEKILQLKSGDIIILDDIKVIVKDETKRTFASVNIRIE